MLFSQFRPDRGASQTSAMANAACRILAASPTHPNKRRVLLLQGPVGPFFKRLQTYLDHNNFCAWRVSFHTADTLFCNTEKTLQFRGAANEWRAWFHDVLLFGSFDTVVLFGAERPAHQQARTIATSAGIDVICLEEGYVRPGFITVEHQGNNASSPLAGQINDTENGYHCPQVGPIGGNSLRRLFLYGALYYTVRGLTTLPRSRRLFHRQTPLLSEAFYWTRNLARRITQGPVDFGKIQSLLEHFDKQFYLIPLQVSADANLIQFSNGWSSDQLISQSIQSFRLHAPKGTRLVFKIHPMERGHHQLKPLIQRVARNNTVSDRIDVIETGSLGLLTRHCAGMITINSTSAFSAIFHGAPLLVLGRALYAHPVLASIGNGFDAFWTTQHVASAGTRTAYLNWIKARALKPGDYYADAGIDEAVKSVFAKLSEAKIAPSERLLLKAAS